MNPCSNHPPNFPPWHGKLSPPSTPNKDRDIEKLARGGGMSLIEVFLLAGLAWAIGLASYLLVETISP